jgi:hypothetical protein
MFLRSSERILIVIWVGRLACTLPDGHRVKHNQHQMVVLLTSSSRSIYMPIIPTSSIASSIDPVPSLQVKPDSGGLRVAKISRSKTLSVFLMHCTSFPTYKASKPPTHHRSPSLISHFFRFGELSGAAAKARQC